MSKLSFIEYSTTSSLMVQPGFVPAIMGQLINKLITACGGMA